MNQQEARRYVADQYGIDPLQLSLMLDAVAPSTLEGWSRLVGQLGHTSAQELRDACIRTGAFSGTQS